MIFPKVTGIKLAKNSVMLISPPLSNIPNGIKYIFATECSKPSATKAEMGNTIAKTLLATSRAAKQSQTARHTSALHKIPLTNACRGSRFILATAMFRAVSSTAPAPSESAPD